MRTIVSFLICVVQWLSDIREVRTEGKLRDDVRQIDNCAMIIRALPLHA